MQMGCVPITAQMSPNLQPAQGSLLQTMVLRMLQGTKWVLGKQGHAHDFDPAQVKAMNVIDGSSLWHFAASLFPLPAPGLCVMRNCGQYPVSVILYFQIAIQRRRRNRM